MDHFASCHARLRVAFATLTDAVVSVDPAPTRDAVPDSIVHRRPPSDPAVRETLP